MQFKIDDNLKKVAAAIQLAPIDYNIFSDLLCRKMIVETIIADIPDNYGTSVIKAAGKSRVFDVVSVLIEYLGVSNLDMDTFDAFCNCVVIGDGDCPECGGELEHVENEGHEIKDGDYLTPNTYVVDKYVYRCRECGEIFKFDQEL